MNVMFCLVFRFRVIGLLVVFVVLMVVSVMLKRLLKRLFKFGLAKRG
jgi:uncharacterized protein HemY